MRSNVPIATEPTMKWVDLAILPHFSWPNTIVELEFEGRRIVMQPATDKFSSSVSVLDMNGQTFDVGGSILSRFLSRLAWSKDGGIVELFAMGSNYPSHPGLFGRSNHGQSGWTAIKPWDLLYLPQPKSAKANLALALFREGMSVNSAPFAFLSYFKILNVLFPEGRQQTTWINNNLANLRYGPELDRLNELNKSQADIGQYLFVQGRCAISHAYGNPIVNPDRYDDKRRLELDVYLMKAIAANFIEQELGVLTDSSFRQLRNVDSASPELLKRVVLSDGKIAYRPTT